MAETDTQTLSLYDITAELRELEEALIESGGEITDEMEERFHALLDMENEKTEGYIAVIQRLTRTAEAVKAEEDRLKKRRRALERSAQSLKDRLCWAMRQRGEEVRETTLGKVRVQQASRRGIVVDVDAEELPDELKRVSVSPDKRAIRAYLEEHGIEHIADGDRVLAHLDEPSYFVRIY